MSLIGNGLLPHYVVHKWFGDFLGLVFKDWPFFVVMHQMAMPLMVSCQRSIMLLFVSGCPLYFFFVLNKFLFRLLVLTVSYVQWSQKSI